MITFHVSTDITDDHRVVLNVQPEVPTGTAELVVSVSSAVPEASKQPRSSLAEWADQQAEHWGEQLSSIDVAGFTGRRF